MRGHAELLDDDLRVLGQARNRLASMQRATAKAAALTEDLLTYSRRRTDDPEIIDLHDVITARARDAAPTRERRRRHRARTSPRTATTIHADPCRIEQVLVNLVVNATRRDARGGTFTDRDVEPDLAGRSAEHSSRLAVADTGIGIPPTCSAGSSSRSSRRSPRARVPASGCRPPYGVVRDYGGTIAVESEAGHRHHLRHRRCPTSPTASGRRRDRHPRAGGRRTAPRRSCRRRRARRARRSSPRCSARPGYRVVEAADAAAAHSMCLAHADPPVDLVVSDVVMPGIGGPELAELILGALPRRAGAVRVRPRRHRPDRARAAGRHAAPQAVDRTALIDPRDASIALALLTGHPTGQGSKRYPTPRTVTIRRGALGSSSIFARSRCTCSLTVAMSCHSGAECHTFTRSCSRENTCWGAEHRNSSRSNSRRRQLDRRTTKVHFTGRGVEPEVAELVHRARAAARRRAATPSARVRRARGARTASRRSRRRRARGRRCDRSRRRGR